MSKKYRILERQQFEKESVYVAQHTPKFLWLFPYWSTYQQMGCSADFYYDREFSSVDEAKEYIAKEAKWDNWNRTSGDRVIALFQVDKNGVLTEVT